MPRSELGAGDSSLRLAKRFELEAYFLGEFCRSNSVAEKGLIFIVPKGDEKTERERKSIKNPPFHSTVHHLTLPYTILREGSAVECSPSPNLNIPLAGILNLGKVYALS